MIHTQIRIKGKVQGVYFRVSAQSQALKLGLNGMVRNDFNGDVYIEAEGSEDAIQKLIDWCIIGPAKAEVTEVISETGMLKNYAGFAILR
ncbi:MAG: acylphosphatase [Bacteroidia bacterium]|nr:acylphosphatase [Bacteroidia bacterium]